jgi:hypothetical protein
MWSFAAIAIGVLALAVGLSRRASRQMHAGRAINVGNLSDRWLAEQRARRSGSDRTESF